MANVEQKHLKGLTYKTSKPTKGEDGRIKYIPTERALKLDDLLDQRDGGDYFTVVAKDGRKHVVPREPAAPGKPGPEAGAGGGDGE